MKIVFSVFITILLIFSINILSCQNTVDSDEKQKQDKDSVLKFISVKVNNKTFNSENDTLKLVPCDSTKISFIIKDSDKIWKYNVVKISDENDSIQIEINPIDSGLITIKYFIDSSFLPGKIYSKHIGFIDLKGNYYKLNLKIKIEPYVVFRLYRGMCFGSCKNYEINIFNDRSVRYVGYGAVKIKGIRFSSLTTENYEYLIKKFNQEQFMNINYYDTGLSIDTPSYSLRFNLNCNSNVTLRYGSSSVNIPDKLIYLENLIDEVTNSKQWTE